MIQSLLDAAAALWWVAVWALTIGTSVTTLDAIWNDKDLDEAQCGDFALAPLGWAILIVFWFN